ncbi:MAG: hypothetical protein WAV09_04235 [Minisyncoccia bacterium]
MPVTTLTDISDLIVTKLQDLVIEGDSPADDTDLFGEIKDYATNKFAKYPAVTVTPTGGIDGEMKDTGRNVRVYNFKITLWQEQTQAGASPAEADRIMKQACEKVILAFDEDRNFNYKVSRVKVVRMEFNYRVGAGTYDFATFDVNCEVVVPNY